MNALTAWRLSLPEGERTFEAAGRRLGVVAMTLWRYERGRHRIPAERVERYHEITKIPKSRLRPDLYGRRRGGSGHVT